MKNPSSLLVDVESSHIESCKRVWRFISILAPVSSDYNICSHALIKIDVVLGERGTVKSGMQLWHSPSIEWSGSDDIGAGKSGSGRPSGTHCTFCWEQ